MTGPALLLSRAHYPVTALGPGVRAGIWVQGCTIGCAGCMSRDTWEADPRTAVPVDALLGWLRALPEPIDGVTISGGEPFEQPEALGALLRGLGAWRRERPSGAVPVDVLVYSGRTFSRLSRSAESRALLDLCDAVVAGPYVDRLNDGSALRGSANQRIVSLTGLGRERYEKPTDGGSPRMQICVDDGPEGRRVFYIGIPRRGDMDHLSSRIEQAGVRAGEASWRP